MNRERMVEEQLIPRNITHEATLRAMRTVPRHLFVEDAMKDQAYGDFPLPIGRGQTISQPYIVALMTQALNLKGHESVLEIGTGSGYQAAILSQICAKVYTIERIDSLLVQARKVFDSLHYFNILTKLDDGTNGWPEYAPYDAIIVTAGGPKVPEPLLGQLADPGTTNRGAERPQSPAADPSPCQRLATRLRVKGQSNERTQTSNRKRPGACAIY